MPIYFFARGKYFNSLLSFRSWTKSISLGHSNAHDKWRGHPGGFDFEDTDASWMWAREDPGFTTVICRKWFGKEKAINDSRSSARICDLIPYGIETEKYRIRINFMFEAVSLSHSFAEFKYIRDKAYMIELKRFIL